MISTTGISSLNMVFQRYSVTWVLFYFALYFFFIILITIDIEGRNPLFSTKYIYAISKYFKFCTWIDKLDNSFDDINCTT